MGSDGNRTGRGGRGHLGEEFVSWRALHVVLAAALMAALPSGGGSSKNGEGAGVAGLYVTQLVVNDVRVNTTINKQKAAGTAQDLSVCKGRIT